MTEWPTDPEDPVDPALAPLIEAGEGDAEGFEVAERDLVHNAGVNADHGTEQITSDAFDDPEDADSEYGEADEEGGRDR